MSENIMILVKRFYTDYLYIFYSVPINLPFNEHTPYTSKRRRK
jgi:hypothetical protein